MVQVLKDMNKVRLIAWCKQGLLYAASVSQVWGLVAVDVAKQRKVLLDNKEFQLALKLTVRILIVRLLCKKLLLLSGCFCGKILLFFI